MSVAARTVAVMDEIRQSALVLAALELLPGEPGDLTALLRNPVVRELLLDEPHVRERELGSLHLSQLASYLLETLDYGRVEHWAKIVDHGVRARNYLPLVAGTPGYPKRLAEVWDAPPILFRSVNDHVKTSVLDGPSLAIVGGRETTPEVLMSTRLLAATVTKAGVHVVSGLAAGVDTAAHVGALEAGGLTTAVLGTGIERIFPAANADLAALIRGHGMLVSQFAPPAPRTGTTFLRRNAVIAALAQASLVMDARERSGSRHEMEQALRYNRKVMFWKPALANESWARMMVDAELAEFVESAEEALALLG